MSHRTDTAAFDAVIAEWKETVPCEVDTKAGGQCQRPAQWLVNVHGCDRYTACTQHYRAIAVDNERGAARAGSGRCLNCGRVDRTYAEAHTAVRI